MRYFVWERDEEVELELSMAKKLVECQGEMVTMIEHVVDDSDIVADM